MGMFNKVKTEDGGADTAAEKVLTVSKFRCPQNHPCPSVKVCPVGALKQKSSEAPEVNQEKCIKCGNCVDYCPMGAIKFKV